MDFENSKDFPNKTRPTVYKSLLFQEKKIYSKEEPSFAMSGLENQSIYLQLNTRQIQIF